MRGEIAIIDEEGEVIRRIFTQYASSVSPKRIASMLNVDHIPGPRGRPCQFSTIYGNRERGIGILNNELHVGRRVWNRQRFVKDPRTGKRQARPNDDEALVVKEVPELRIVDDGLWDAVKRRQASQALEGSHQKPWDRRRPRYLFSGLMACGVCGSGFSIISPGRFGCSAARNKGETVCTNRSTITREDLEARVLTALTEHLMDPELVRVFCEEYTAETNRLRANSGSARAAKESELAKVCRDHSKLVDAILAGVPGEQVKDRMIALDTRRQQVMPELSATATPDPVRLHPGMADVYRRKVRALVEGLSDADRAPEVSEALRALVDRIVLTPELRPGRKRATLTVNLEGALAGILHLAAGEKGAAVAASIQNTLSASGGVDVARAQNVEEPPVLADGGSSESMAKLVAGAGFEPAAFRL